jgi:HSP20 family molecular chaperone IbpA
MELVLENGWYGNQWMGDHMAPRADVVEDKDAYHFYVEMPGLKDGSIDVRSVDGCIRAQASRVAAGGGGSYRGAGLRHYQTRIQASAQGEPRRHPRGLC